MKKLLSYILVFVLLFSIMPIGMVSFAADEYVEGNYKYEVIDERAIVVDVVNSVDGAITIPDTLGGYPVVAIGEWAFAYSNITEITFPDSLGTICESAFYTARKLETVNFGKGLFVIAARAFMGCEALKSIVLPESTSVVGGGAFSRCTSLESVTLNKDLGYIEMGAFVDCSSLKSIVIPNWIVTLNGTFQRCSSLESVTLGASVEKLDEKTFEGCNSLKTVIAYNVGDCSISSYSGLWKNQTFYAFKGSAIEKFANGLGATVVDLETVHTHSYKNNCDPSCEVCWKDRTVKHNSDKGTVTKKATCTAAGKKVYKCTLCKTTLETKTVAKLAHNYDSGKVTKKATCKVTGVKTYTCEDCGKTKTETIAKLTTHKYKTTTTKATLTKNGKTVKKCSVCSSVYSTKTIKRIKSVKLSKTEYTYNGKTQKPSVVVKDLAGKTISSKYYTVSYASGRKNVGTYKVTVKFKGNYSGTKTLTFKINPPKTTVKSLTAAKKSLKVAITKKSTQVTGYEIQYSTSKKFTKAKSKLLTSYKKTSTTLTKLSAKKTYYVRVRTYKTVNGKKYYSGWSTIKYKKTK